MTNQEKLKEIAEILDREAEEINEETLLSEIEEWDSVAVLSFISVMNDNFQKFPDAKEIRSYKTVGDLMNVMHD